MVKGVFHLKALLVVNCCSENNDATLISDATPITPINLDMNGSIAVWQVFCTRFSRRYVMQVVL